MNQGTQGYSLTKKTEGRKSRETVPLNEANTCVALVAGPQRGQDDKLVQQ
jgi:hypothetical protein